MKLRSWIVVASVASMVASCTGGSTHVPTAPSEPTGAALADSLQPSEGYASYCGGAADCPSGGVPKELWRPIHLPTVEPGQACPSMVGHHVSSTYGLAIGGGPIYAITASPLTFDYPPQKGSLFYGSGWGGQRILWVGRPDYTGPVLLRGEGLDISSPLGFMDTAPPLADLQLPPGKGHDPRGWRGWPSFVRLRAPGCYGVQIDGIGFSEIITLYVVMATG